MQEDYSLYASNLTTVAGTVRLMKGKHYITAKELGNAKVVICPECREISIFIDVSKYILLRIIYIMLFKCKVYYRKKR